VPAEAAAGPARDPAELSVEESQVLRQLELALGVGILPAADPPAGAAGRLWTHQLLLTILDLYLEIFHTHHPLGDGYAYEEQKAAARRRTRDFLRVRLPKFLTYFERVLTLNRAHGPWMVGARVSCAALSMAPVLAGLRYAFPIATGRALRSQPRLRTLHDAVFERPRIARYLASGRRVAFNNEDLFRHYPQLDR